MSKEKGLGFISALIVVFFTISIVVVVILNTAAAIMLTWNLFVPKFFGVSHLTIVTAILLSCTVSVIKGSTMYRTDDMRCEETKTKDVYYILLSPWVAYLIALITSTLFSF